MKRTHTKNQLFEGMSGRATALVMARMNREAELEAINILSPSPHDTVLAIGVGSGVGARLLATRVSQGVAVAIDPSEVMVAETKRRNRREITEGRLIVHVAAAHAIPYSSTGFDGAVAVNSLQLWEPMAPSLVEVARVLRPAAKLVTITHDWAIQRSTGRDVDEWFDWISTLASGNGFVEATMQRASADKGTAVLVSLTRSQH